MTELITTAQLAELLSVDRSTITRRVQSGDLVPTFSREGHGGFYLFDASTVDLKGTHAREVTE
ncbi:MAG: helix-turn-helix domain-containing protein [Microbacteriaceae bacterium]